MPSAMIIENISHKQQQTDTRPNQRFAILEGRMIRGLGNAINQGGTHNRQIKNAKNIQLAFAIKRLKAWQGPQH